MSTNSKMNLTREDFSNLLRHMKAQSLDEECSAFFDYLLHQKISLFKKIYPHCTFCIQGQKDIKELPNLVVLSETISYTDFLHFFQKSIEDVFYANNS